MQTNNSNDSNSQTHNDNVIQSNDISNQLSQNLRAYRIRNVGKIIVATLNINSIRNKFDELKMAISGNIDVLVITETKLDHTFPTGQFFIEGFATPFRLDRNSRGGGILIYVREDIPSKQLSTHTFNEGIEGIFFELNLNKYKLLMLGTYRPPTQEKYFYFHNISNSLDLYIGKYDRFMLIGDFNIDENEQVLMDFNHQYD